MGSEPLRIEVEIEGAGEGEAVELIDAFVYAAESHGFAAMAFRSGPREKDIARAALGPPDRITPTRGTPAPPTSEEVQRWRETETRHSEPVTGVQCGWCRHRWPCPDVLAARAALGASEAPTEGQP